MVTDTPASLDGTQFCAIIATLKLGMNRDYKVKLGPKHRVNLEITVEISVGKNAMENLVLTSVENRGPIVKLPSKWPSLWF